MEIEAIRALVDQALQDGRLTQAEQDQITDAIRSDGKVSLEELELMQLILDKISAGEVEVVD